MLWHNFRIFLKNCNASTKSQSNVRLLMLFKSWSICHLLDILSLSFENKLYTLISKLWQHFRIFCGGSTKSSILCQFTYLIEIVKYPQYSKCFTVLILKQTQHTNFLALAALKIFFWKITWWLCQLTLILFKSWNICSNLHILSLSFGTKPNTLISLLCQHVIFFLKIAPYSLVLFYSWLLIKIFINICNVLHILLFSFKNKSNGIISLLCQDFRIFLRIYQKCYFMSVD